MEPKSRTQTAPEWRKLLFDPRIGDCMLLFLILLIPSPVYRIFSGILVLWTYYRTHLVYKVGNSVECETNTGQFPSFSQSSRGSDSGFSEADTEMEDDFSNQFEDNIMEDEASVPTEAETLLTDQWAHVLDTNRSSNYKEQFADTEMEDNFSDQFEDNLTKGKVTGQSESGTISTDHWTQMLDTKKSIDSTYEKQLTNLEMKDNLTRHYTNGLTEEDGNFSDFFPTDFQTQLELLEELNKDIMAINNTAREILNDKIDNTLQKGRENLQEKLDKIQNISRNTRTSFKQATRKNFPPSIAESLVQNPVLLKNQDLIEYSKELIMNFNQLIKDRGLNLGPMIGKQPKKIWPIFDGQNLPILSDFLSEINDLCIDQGLSISNRGGKLYRQIKGTAKNFLDSQLDELNPTYERIKHILMLGFGKPEQIEELLTNLHRKLPPISASGIEIKAVKEHKQIVDIMLQQHKKWELKKQGESPLTARYVKTIMEKIPKYHLFNLYSEPNFSNLSHQSKFDCIVLEFQKLYNFANNCFIFQTQNSHFLPHNQLKNDFSKPPPNYNPYI